jgi:hypothetical protein
MGENNNVSKLLVECGPISPMKESGLTSGGVWECGLTLGGVWVKWAQRRVWANNWGSVGQIGVKETVG